jgi:TRAP-type C4-dicarboxylate transport system permease small subunit
VGKKTGGNLVSEHGSGSKTEAAIPATVFGRAGQGIVKFIDPIYKWLGWGGALVLFALVVLMIYSALGRYIGHPLNGSGDIIQYSFLVMIALAIGTEHLGHEKMVVDAVVKFFPKKMQQVLEPIIHLLVIAILIVAVWQLIKHGVRLAERGEHTKGTLHLIKAPFAFVAAFGIFTVIPIMVARCLESIDRLVKR